LPKSYGGSKRVGECKIDCEHFYILYWIDVKCFNRQFTQIVWMRGANSFPKIDWMQNTPWTVNSSSI
jgi:hypothetical protein